MARTAEGPHPLTGKVFTLSDQGFGQRQIAAETGLSQPTVSRILSGPRPVGPSDDDGVFAEFEDLAKAAFADGSVDALRHVHEAARVCRINGYQVPWHALPLIMKLSEVAIEASAAERRKLRAEVKAIYADIKPVAADAE